MKRTVDWTVYAIPGSYTLPVTGASRLEFACTGCGTPVSTNLKNLKSKIRGGSPFLCGSCSIKALWSKPGFREKISQEKIWSDPVLRSRASASSKKKWEDPSYARKQEESHSDPAYLVRAADRSRAMWDSGFRERQKSIREDPAWKERMSLAMKAVWEDPNYVAKVKRSLSRTFSSGIPSSLEASTSNILSSRGIRFEREFPVGPFLFDFFLPDSDVLIECQGEYWHSLPRAASRDASKFSYVSSARPSSRVLYLHERDFLNPLHAEQKILSFLGLSSPSVVVHDFSLSDVSIDKVDVRIKVKKSLRSPAQEFLDSFHYAQFGRSSRAVYGGFLDGKLVAVCKFSTVIRKESATSMGLPPSRVLELDRFCIHPSYQKKNFASWFLARCVSRVFSDFPDVLSLISFSDMTMGHTGTIYRASNWTLSGVVPPDYHYVNADGWMLHKKTLWNHASRNGMSEKEYAELHGFSRVFGREKFKFVMGRRP